MKTNELLKLYQRARRRANEEIVIPSFPAILDVHLLMDLFSAFLLTILGIVLMGKGSDWLTDSLIPIARKLVL